MRRFRVFPSRPVVHQPPHAWCQEEEPDAERHILAHPALDEENAGDQEGGGREAESQGRGAHADDRWQAHASYDAKICELLGVSPSIRPCGEVRLSASARVGASRKGCHDRSSGFGLERPFI